jgi:hypothetical protein
VKFNIPGATKINAGRWKMEFQYIEPLIYADARYPTAQLQLEQSSAWEAGSSAFGAAHDQALWLRSCW